MKLVPHGSFEPRASSKNEDAPVNDRTEAAREPYTYKAGFTVVELVVVCVILSVLASMAYPPIAASVSTTRTENAARVIASDLRQAVTLAARQGAPVRVQFDANGLELRLVNRAGQVLHRRALGSGTEFPLDSASASTTSVDVFPNRVASGPFAITLSTPAASGQVTMSRATLIRIEEL
jgi:prepilin-type N-terminal cleavage/methylation domain-containing protein